MKKLFAYIALGLLCSQSSIISSNKVDGLNNIVHYGQNNRISGRQNQVFGYQNNISGQGNSALGLNNQLKGVGNLVNGIGNTISGKNNLVGGHGNIVLGSDATEEEKALLNQKMMNVFASRGIAGVPGLAVANSPISDNAREPSAAFSPPKDNKNPSLQLQALQKKIPSQPKQAPPQKVDNLKKPSPVQPQSVNPEPSQKKEQKSNPQSQAQDKIKPETTQAYVIETKDNKHDYNLANKEEIMPADDLTFFNDDKNKAKENKENPSSSSQKNIPEQKVEVRPSSSVVQSVSRSQEPKKVVTSLPVQPIQPKTEILKVPESKPVEPVKTEVKTVETPKISPVAQKQPLPEVAVQNKVQAQQNKVQAQQNNIKIESQKQESGFKFYVDDGKKIEPDSKTQAPVSTRYARGTKKFDKVPQIVTVPQIRSSNLRQEQDPKPKEVQIVRNVEKTQTMSDNVESIKVIQPSSSVVKEPQTSRNSGYSISLGNPLVTVISGGLTPTSSSSSSSGRYRRESSEVIVPPKVVVSTSSSVSSSSRPRNANDVAASYLSSGNPSMNILPGEKFFAKN